TAWQGFWAVRRRENCWEKLDLDLDSLTIPPHIAGCPKRIEQETAEYEFWAENGNHFASYAGVLSSGVLDELPIGKDMPPLFFVGRTLQEVQEKVEKATKLDSAEQSRPYRIQEQHREFNIIAVRDRVFALRASIGEVDLNIPEDTLMGQLGA